MRLLAERSRDVARALRMPRQASDRPTKAATRGERYGGLDVTLTRANADTGQWRWRESNLVGDVGNRWCGAVTCGDVPADRVWVGSVASAG